MTQPKALPTAVPGERPMKNRGQVLGHDLNFIVFQWGFVSRCPEATRLQSMVRHFSLQVTCGSFVPALT